MACCATSAASDALDHLRGLPTRLSKPRQRRHATVAKSSWSIGIPRRRQENRASRRAGFETIVLDIADPNTRAREHCLGTAELKRRLRNMRRKHREEITPMSDSVSADLGVSSDIGGMDTGSIDSGAFDSALSDAMAPADTSLSDSLSPAPTDSVTPTVNLSAPDPTAPDLATSDLTPPPLNLRRQPTRRIPRRAIPCRSASTFRRAPLIRTIRCVARRSTTTPAMAAASRPPRSRAGPATAAVTSRRTAGLSAVRWSPASTDPMEPRSAARWSPRPTKSVPATLPPRRT